MSKAYIGIDPGSEGFIAVIKADGERDFLPIKGSAYSVIVDFLRSLRSSGGVFCCMEDVHAVFGSAAGATFEFGRVNGLLEGMLVALCIPYQKVPPKTWQSAVWAHSDKVYVSKGRKVKGGEVKTVSSVDTKRTSMNAAVRLFPDVDFRKSLRGRNLDDNKCDAMLICEYGRRMNL